MSGKHEKRSGVGGGLAAFGFTFVLLLAAYITSLGPVARYSSVRVWEVYSYPAQFVYDRGYGEWLNVYVTWWCE